MSQNAVSRTSLPGRSELNGYIQRHFLYTLIASMTVSTSRTQIECSCISERNYIQPVLMTTLMCRKCRKNRVHVLLLRLLFFYYYTSKYSRRRNWFEGCYTALFDEEYAWPKRRVYPLPCKKRGMWTWLNFLWVLSVFVKSILRFSFF